MELCTCHRPCLLWTPLPMGRTWSDTLCGVSAYRLTVFPSPIPNCLAFIFCVICGRQNLPPSLRRKSVEYWSASSTLEERAQRLFSTKGKRMEDMDPSMFAKSKPGKAGKSRWGWCFWFLEKENSLRHTHKTTFLSYKSVCPSFSVKFLSHNPPTHEQKLWADWSVEASASYLFSSCSQRYGETKGVGSTGGPSLQICWITGWAASCNERKRSTQTSADRCVPHFLHPYILMKPEIETQKIQGAKCKQGRLSAWKPRAGHLADHLMQSLVPIFATKCNTDHNEGRHIGSWGPTAWQGVWELSIGVRGGGVLHDNDTYTTP